MFKKFDYKRGQLKKGNYYYPIFNFEANDKLNLGNLSLSGCDGRDVCVVEFEDVSDLKTEEFYGELMKAFRKNCRREEIVIWINRPEREVWFDSPNRDLFNYFDSSIWHYFYDKGVDENDAGISNIKGCPNLVQISKEIAHRVKVLGKNNVSRYDLAVAEEYRDFNQRKWENSYIEGEGGHSKGVLPFVHHSEYAMWKNLEKELSGSMLGGGYEWRLLLVDDHAVEGMHIGGEKKTDSRKNVTDFGKIDIIKDDLLWLNQGYGASRSAEAPAWYSDKKIKIECVDSKDKALNKLKDGYRYDVILLDYKLDKKADTGQSYGCDLGTEILSDLGRGLENKEYHPCPAGEYNFMFISAYPTAVQEDMLSRGLYVQTDNWFVRRGACPTNTPWLFLFELYRIMDRRMKRLKAHLAMIKKIDDKPLQPTALSFISWLYAEPTRCRDKCKNAFNAFLTLRSTYDIIKYDVYKEETKDLERFVDKEEKESLLIKSMFPDVVCYSNTFWEHMQHLVYLTAYGTNRQWSEMWEELMCISELLDEAEQEIRMANPNASNLPMGTVKKIRTYILGLKNGNY